MKRENPLIKCACGCGELLFKYNKWGYLRKGICGHGKRKNVSEETLRQLYLIEGKSMREIGRILGCTHRFISLRLKEYQIFKRKCFKSYTKPNLTMSANMSYLLGVICGDGTCYKLKSGAYIVKLGATELSFVSSFSNSLKSINLKPSEITIEKRPKYGREKQKELYIVNTYSKAFYEYFAELKIEHLKQIIGKKPTLIISWLKGFYESEGCFGDRGNSHGLRISITNTNKELVDMASYFLECLHIKYSISTRQRKHWKLVYDIKILGSRLEKENFIKLLNPCIKAEPLRWGI